MKNWQVDLFTGLEQATNMQDVLDITMRTIKPMGFDFCGWRSMLPLPMSTKKIITLGAQEDEVTEKENSGEYLESPLSKHCARSMEPFSWQGIMEEYWAYKAPEMAEEYYGWGHKGGWAQSLVTGGGMYSMLWADSKSVFTLKDINDFDFKMQWVATAVLTRMNQVKERSTIELSLREKEVLRWTGDGKTADQIAEILMLSPSTINFHLRNAMKKLDAPNKTTAVVRAIFLKLLC